MKTTREKMLGNANLPARIEHKTIHPISMIFMAAIFLGENELHEISTCIRSIYK